jgi:hypothetical protein
VVFPFRLFSKLIFSLLLMLVLEKALVEVLALLKLPFSLEKVLVELMCPLEVFMLTLEKVLLVL